MDAKPKPVNRVYEDIDPQIEWAYEEGLDTVMVHLPAFRKEQLKVEVASSGNIRVSGQRALGNNKWKRFVKEIPIPSNVDNNAIHANFQENILYIKLPKVIAPVPKPHQQTKPRLEIPQQKPTSEPKPQVQTPPIIPQQKPTSEPKPQVQTPPIIPQQNPTSEPKPQVAGGQKLPPPKPNVDGKSNNANDNANYVAAQKKPNEGEESGGTIWNSSAAMQGNDVFQKTTEKAKEQTSSIDGKSTSSTAAETITRVSERQGEKNEPIDANKKKSIATVADNVSQENLEKERSGWFEKTGEVTSSSTSEKHGNIFDTVMNAVMMMDKGARGNEDGSGKYVVEGYKQVVGGMATELKKKNLINLVVAGLLVLVLALYVKNALFKTV